MYNEVFATNNQNAAEWEIYKGDETFLCAI